MLHSCVRLLGFQTPHIAMPKQSKFFSSKFSKVKVWATGPGGVLLLEPVCDGLQLALSSPPFTGASHCVSVANILFTRLGRLGHTHMAWN